LVTSATTPGAIVTRAGGSATLEFDIAKAQSAAQIACRSLIGAEFSPALSRGEVILPMLSDASPPILAPRAAVAATRRKAQQEPLAIGADPSALPRA
jgi:hypothetical protein